MNWRKKIDQLETADPMGKLRRRNRVLFVPAEMVRRFFTDMISKSAAELAYFMLFSLFPLLIFATVVMSRVNVTEEFWTMAARLLPQQVVEVIAGYLEYVGTLPSNSLLYFGLVLSVYLFARSINSLLRSINFIYRKPGRMGVVRFIASILFSLTFMIAIVLLLGLVVAGRVVYHYLIRVLPALAEISYLWNWLRYGAVVVFVLLVLVMLYYIVPNRHIPLRYVMPGAFFTIAVWLGMSEGFSYYVNNMNNYSVLYGSLGAIMLLMLWLYLMGVVMLMGAVLIHILYDLKNPEAKNS